MLTLEMIDVLVPEHTVLRYQEKVICSDDDRVGGLNFDKLDKEYRCKRCCLLDILYETHDCSEQPRIHIDVLDVGTVR